MYKTIAKDIKKFHLDTSLYDLHRTGYEETDFGLNNSKELIDGGFGLYSTAGTKERIGPVKTEYYRIGLLRKGSFEIDIGLEHHKPTRNSIILGFPGQIFSLYNQSEDSFAYYMLFSEKFIAEAVLGNYKQQLPFFTYSGVHCFQLTEATAQYVETIILKINQEIKNRKADFSKAIQLYIQLILIEANRNYGNMILDRQAYDSSDLILDKFVKLISQHFLKLHKVSDYAKLLHVSPDYLNRIARSKSGKTAHELINDMIIMEAKAYLLHSKLSIAEIAYKLDFTDPSYFNKFFRKIAGCTPLEYRHNSSSLVNLSD